MGGEGANYQALLTDWRGRHSAWGLPAHGGDSRTWPPLPNKLSETEAVYLAVSNGPGDGWKMTIRRKRGGGGLGLPLSDRDEPNSSPIWAVE